MLFTKCIALFCMAYTSVAAGVTNVLLVTWNAGNQKFSEHIDQLIRESLGNLGGSSPKPDLIVIGLQEIIGAEQKAVKRLSYRGEPYTFIGFNSMRGVTEKKPNMQALVIYARQGSNFNFPQPHVGKAGTREHQTSPERAETGEEMRGTAPTSPQAARAQSAEAAAASAPSDPRAAWANLKLCTERGDLAEGKGGIIAFISSTTGTINFITAHLNSKDPSKREEQVRSLITASDELQKRCAPTGSPVKDRPTTTFFMGDLNYRLLKAKLGQGRYPPIGGPRVLTVGWLTQAILRMEGRKFLWLNSSHFQSSLIRRNFVFEEPHPLFPPTYALSVPKHEGECGFVFGDPDMLVHGDESDAIRRCYFESKEMKKYVRDPHLRAQEKSEVGEVASTDIVDESKTRSGQIEMGWLDLVAYRTNTKVNVFKYTALNTPLSDHAPVIFFAQIN